MLPRHEFKIKLPAVYSSKQSYYLALTCEPQRSSLVQLSRIHILCGKFKLFCYDIGIRDRTQATSL